MRACAVLPALVLILLGALTKSAQFPSSSGCPRHGGAHAGVGLPALGHHGQGRRVLLARLWPVLAAPRMVLDRRRRGCCTLLIGGYARCSRTTSRACWPIRPSHLGLITLLLGLNSPLAAVAAVFHIMNHATFKASLFMAAGIIDHESGTRDIRRLSGLRS
jgi:multicomponent K+:H+ antiporter subunit A